MTKQIDDLMVLAWAMTNALSIGAKTRAESELRTALEAALKPGEPAAKYIGECADGSLVQLYDEMKNGTELYAAAPPAQTHADDESVYGSIMGAAYDFRDAHLTGSTNLKRTAHEELDAAVRQALTPAPPAQTPPRLTDEQLSQVMEQVDFTYAPTKFARAIETAVRKQFGVQE
jgi:hypothetical protein